MPDLNLGNVIGPAGKSAYQYALDGGYTGTEEEFQAMLGSGPWVPQAGFVPASNTNLLDNWYCQDPINQRGIISGSLMPHGYGLDRWIVRQDNQAKWIFNEGFYIMNTLESGYQAIDQRMIVSFLPNGTPVTISVIYKDEGESTWKILSATGYWGTSLNSVKDGNFNIGLTYAYPSSDLTTFRIVSYPGSTKVVIAAKLEIGNIQTLARKDADGNWVLNDPPPNKKLELLKCQNYQEEFVYPRNRDYMGGLGFGIAQTATQALIQIPTMSTAMRNGTLKISGKWALYDPASSTSWNDSIPVNTFSITFGTAGMLNVLATVGSGLTVGKVYTLIHLPPDAGVYNSFMIDRNI